MERVCCDTTYPPNPCGVVILCCAGHVAHALHESENGTAGGYRAHMCGFWRPVHCLSATAVSLSPSMIEWLMNCLLAVQP